MPIESTNCQQKDSGQRTVMRDIKSRLQQPASEASRRLTKSNQASRTNNLPAYLKTKLKENTGDSELATHPCR
ncbi:hypothetical protein COCOBI_02-3510 [Coccomyxa sp. Obi]|nr:hypothetical protein COCOBI_02-3510 [Coccomyxa sp. Obi]